MPPAGRRWVVEPDLEFVRATDAAIADPASKELSAYASCAGADLRTAHDQLV